MEKQVNAAVKANLDKVFAAEQRAAAMRMAWTGIVLLAGVGG